MKNILILISVFFLLDCNSKGKETLNVSETDLNQAKLAFNELSEALSKDGGKLWNHSLNGPVLLINRETRIIIANEPDEKGGLIKHGDYYCGKFPENMNIANSSTEWNGKRWTMVGLPLPETRDARMMLLIHESFHRLQPEIGFDSLNEIQNAHLDTKEGRIFIKLELEALKKALNSDDFDMHLKNALKFRKYRQQIFPNSKTSENSLEISEGIAEFTGSVLCGLNNKELQKHYISKIDQLYSMPTFVRSFAYFTIPVYGYFMKMKDDKWNLKIDKKTNLTDFISDFFELPKTILNKNDIQKLGKSYNIDSICNFEENREINRLKQIKKYKKLFLEDQVLEIQLEKMEIGFNPGNLMPLDSLGTVYPNLRITDNWGILEVDSCGALVSPNWDKVTISSPLKITDALITGNGWKLKLNSMWQLEKQKTKNVLIKK